MSPKSWAPTQAAEAAYETAKLGRELAEIALKEYQEGIFPQDVASAEFAIKLAESDRARAQDRSAGLADRQHRRPGRGSTPGSPLQDITDWPE